MVKVIVSGGGTGGHIFPAIAIANALKSNVRDIEILFVGAEGRMEMEKVPAAGYRIEGLWISGLQRKLTLKNLAFPFKVISSVMRSRSIIREFKPDVVIGVGGYASGPLLFAATSMNVPALIQEQNSFPGITNKMLASRVDKICVAYDGMERFFPKEKVIFTGNPVRQDILQLSGKKERALELFSLKPGKKTLLVIGGSLGARTINESIAACADTLTATGIQIVWQTGKSFFQTAKAIAEKNENVKVFDFIQQMDYAYAVSDAVVSRAGASSVSELCIVQKPSILVPSPNVAEDHQTKNAMALVNHHAAILVKDMNARNTLESEVLALMKDEELMNKLSRNIAALAMPDSANVIAHEVIKLVKK